MPEDGNKEDSRREDGDAHEYVSAGRPGSEFETREIPAIDENAGPEKPDKQDEAKDKPHPFDEDELETREVPALKEEWRERASEAAEALGETADVVGAFDDEDVGDPSLAASVAAATGEAPLPREDEPAEIVGPILDRARLAQRDWAAKRFEQRTGLFHAMRREMIERRNDHVPGMATSIGRPMVETLTGEYLPVLEALRAVESVVPPLLVEHFSGDAPWIFDGLTGSTRLVPYGVVVIVNAAGSPFALPMTLAIDALAAGNAVVICGNESHPRVNEIMRRVFLQAGLPEGLAQVLAGDSETLRAMVDQGPDKLVFEGDEELAARVAASCVVNDCEFQFVRPSKDLLVVLDSADVDRAVEGAIFAAFHSGGMAPGVVERIVVHQSLYDEFRMKFIDAIREMNSHHAQLAHIKDAFRPQWAARLIDDAVAEGARVTYPAGEEPGRWIHWKAVLVEGLTPAAGLSKRNFEGPGVALYRAEDPVAEVRNLLAIAPACNLSVIGDAAQEAVSEFQDMPVSRVAFGEPVVAGSATAGGVPVGSETPRGIGGPRAMLRPQAKFVSSRPARRVAWFPYTDDKAYAMMDALEGMYGVKRGSRIKGILKLALNPTLRRLLKSGD